MYKFLSIIVSLLLMINMSAFAADIELQPTMRARTNAQDRVWVGTLQLVWNDFISKYVHNPVRFREGTPKDVQDLNRQEFSVKDLSDKCFYKYAGAINKRTKKMITKAIKKKLNETSDILDKMDLTPGSNSFLIYTMLKKDFDFIYEFDKLDKSTFGENFQAEYFGITSKTSEKVAENIEVLFYNNSDDFALKIKTKDKDELYLYKNPSNKSFRDLYADMNRKSAKYEGRKDFQKEDMFKVPNLKLDVTRDYEEFAGKRVMGTNLVITKVIQTAKFDMNNKGVKLKSEAAMTIMKTALQPQINEPRYFYLDDTFVLYLKENDKRNPYFALRVNDISKFQ